MRPSFRNFLGGDGYGARTLRTGRLGRASVDIAAPNVQVRSVYIDQNLDRCSSGHVVKLQVASIDTGILPGI